ncbi:hypothetical protein BS50DRAFT_662738 [Corynespora cassiicola Philippines]|uniref:Transcription factor domain-containing protein n=1 Tax=Corynespora cassiicola Philippines TaxID=1448308 RepID=A0A2T2NYJ5_CORCC|nr:hypothetical protein BS50DRAFT_662738 [Corynespora cassiicola Philippines]
MQAPSGASSPSDRAQQVCLSCKTRKRKFGFSGNKPCLSVYTTDGCANRRGSTCQYSRPNGNRTPQSTSDVSRDNFYPLNYGFPRAQYIDFSSTVPLCRGAPTSATLLGSIDDIKYSASSFFTTIHTWMSLVPKKRFYDVYLRSAFQSRADLVLLFLALKLVTTPPPTNPHDAKTQLYNDTKHFYLEVEGSMIFSISVLQAGIVITLYELGHGIYPAAYMSVGAYARVWWAVVILDRFFFAATEPLINDSFPADDAEWDEEVVRRDPCYTLSSPNVTYMSRLSLLCQAARMLGQVLEAVSNAAGIQEDTWKQLEITLDLMLFAALNIESPGFYQIAFIYRYNFLSSNCPDIMSPWGLFFTYQICTFYLRAGIDDEALGPLRNSLSRLDAQWKAACKWSWILINKANLFLGKYMQLLEAQEILVHSEQRTR